MHKHYILFLAFFSILVGQGSMLDMEDMTNTQLDDIREQLKTDPLADTRTVLDPKIETLAIEIDRDAKELEEELSELSEYFGYGYFKRKINFFDNVPTPVDFKLGAGDEIILSLWGQINLQEKFIINKDGLIYYKNIGFINLANKTIDEAELILRDKLSQTYSTIKNTENSTNLMLELGKLRSVNVYFSGQISNPGIHVIHPFSDIFSAIIQADGIKSSGSLRHVQLIRDRKIIHTIDFYDFFTNGKSDFTKIRILEGDVIHIPQINHRNEILGAVEQPGYYELLPGELLSDIVGYAGGFTVNAANTIMLHWVVPVEERSSIDDTQRLVAVTQEEANQVIVKAGTTIHVESVRAMSTGVLVYGRVKNPGYYPASKSLKEVLDLAGGFNDPLYVQSIRTDEIKVLRRDGSNYYASEFTNSYKESDTFDLLPDDKVFVYEDSKYRNIPTVRIEGEVNRSGTFPFKQGMTIQDVINLAEGFTPFANPKGVILFDEWSPLFDKDELEEKDMSHTPLMQDPVANTTPEFKIAINAFIRVLPLKNHVLIQGAVYRPGLVTYTESRSVKFYLEQSGGATSLAEFKDSYLTRANGEIVTLNKRNQRWVKVEPGDEIFIPTDMKPSEFDATKFTSDIVSILTNLATIIFIVDSNSK
jgi:protein involved in polysaccharide export with SLBB domain